MKIIIVVVVISVLILWIINQDYYYCTRTPQKIVSGRVSKTDPPQNPTSIPTDTWTQSQCNSMKEKKKVGTEYNTIEVDPTARAKYEELKKPLSLKKQVEERMADMGKTYTPKDLSDRMVKLHLDVASTISKDSHMQEV